MTVSFVDAVYNGKQIEIAKIEMEYPLESQECEKWGHLWLWMVVKIAACINVKMEINRNIWKIHFNNTIGNTENAEWTTASVEKHAIRH